MNTRRIEGKVALVTVASRGNGRALMEVNYFGPPQLLQRLAPTLARNGGGAVVVIGSTAGLTNVPFIPTCSASKAALHSLTQAARVLLAAQGTTSERQMAAMTGTMLSGSAA